MAPTGPPCGERWAPLLVSDAIDDDVCSTGLHRLLQILGGSESNFLGSRDFHGLARLGFATHASGALAHLQNAKAGQPDLVALLSGSWRSYRPLGSTSRWPALGNLMRLRKPLRDIAQRQHGTCTTC